MKNITFEEKDYCIDALQIYMQYKDIDFADAYAVASMETLQLKRIFSCDRDFDRFPEIERQEPE